MRIAVAAAAPNQKQPVARHGARADFYLVFDEAANTHEALANPFKDYPKSVGIRVADFLADKSIDLVVAGRFGVGFARALDSKGVRHKELRGTIEEVVKDILGSADPSA